MCSSDLNARQAPAPISTISSTLAIAALKSPPDVTPLLEERERLAEQFRAIGLEPNEANANFVFVPVADARALSDALLKKGMVIRAYDDGIRVTVRDQDDDDALIDAIARILDRPSPVTQPSGRRVRHLRATAETRIAVRLGLDGESRVSVQDRKSTRLNSSH